jgi:hypothetical protein
VILPETGGVHHLSDELLLSQVVSQEAVIRLLVEKGIFSKGRVFGNGESGKS